MIPGPGFADAEGVYHVGEADNPDNTFSGLSQLVTEAISDQFTLDRAALGSLDARVDKLELLASAAPATVATVSLNNAFPTGFNRFRVEYQLLSTGNAEIRLRFRTAGVDDSTANYGIVGSYGQTQFVLSPAAGAAAFYWGSVVVDSVPPSNVHTVAIEANSRNNSTGAVVATRTAGYHNAGTPDGFTIIASTGTFTGWVRVVGVA